MGMILSLKSSEIGLVVGITHIDFTVFYTSSCLPILVIHPELLYDFPMWHKFPKVFDSLIQGTYLAKYIRILFNPFMQSFHSRKPD